MDETAQLETRQRARRLRSARRRRLGELRRKALLFSSLTFAAAWAVVFGQMALGRDPVLSAHQHPPSSDSGHSQAPSAPRQSSGGLTVDPVTGLIERAPTTESPAATPSPPPVTTAQS